MGTLQKVEAAISSKVAIKNAIESKGVVVGNIPFDEYAGKIEEIGKEEEYLDDVIFIDYDGTVVYSYTAQEFLQLAELPENPTHEGLTSQGWNWTLAEAKAYVTDAGGLVIGQQYITSDGKSRFYISLDDVNHLSPTVQAIANDVVDWGDGSEPETFVSNGYKTHTYTSVGDYVITLASNSPTHGLVAQPITAQTTEKIFYFSKVKKIHLGNVYSSLVAYTFQNYTGLEYVTLPNNITSFSAGAFADRCVNLKACVLPINFVTLGNITFSYNTSIKIISFDRAATCGISCFTQLQSLRRLCLPVGMVTTWGGNSAFSYAGHLKRVEIPNDYTSLVNNVFQRCTLLEKIKLSNSLTTLNSYVLSDCYVLKHVTIPPEVVTIGERAFQGTPITSITIPSKVTQINNYAFYTCTFLKDVYVLPTIPPTIGTGIFQSTSIEKIYVPQGFLSAYQSASNWSAYADHMVEYNFNNN